MSTFQEKLTFNERLRVRFLASVYKGAYYMIDAVFFVIHRSVFNINATSFRSTVLQHMHGEIFDIQQGKAGLMN